MTGKHGHQRRGQRGAGVVLVDAQTPVWVGASGFEQGDRPPSERCAENRRVRRSSAGASSESMAVPPGLVVVGEGVRLDGLEGGKRGHARRGRRCVRTAAIELAELLFAAGGAAGSPRRSKPIDAASMSAHIASPSSTSSAGTSVSHSISVGRRRTSRSRGVERPDRRRHARAVIVDQHGIVADLR